LSQPPAHPLDLLSVDYLMDNLKEILDIAAARHSHLCPRQILGARIGLVGASALGLDVPRGDKRLLVILETDGCFADGIEVATGCAMGHRTLRIEDYGKIAATFVDVADERALRVAPRRDVRQRAYAYAPGETRHYFAQLRGYQVMPDEELVTIEAVQLVKPIRQIVSRPGVRVNCAGCGEEIINEREIVTDGQPFCYTCAQGGYYASTILLPIPQRVYQDV
jgi:formylmethanofuran dehydrogenase subunit E